ncbi:uncharacterized protein LOC133832722 [Humulus lupulus]|uniref:uncharacterized protein LOC133832722 n=1 Tax=Humulus lupulus TaxID=3486 RepID=UPI002B40FD85|nr:uncharacterized protein LOC133832722 [Humulus lupulus]
MDELRNAAQPWGAVDPNIQAQLDLLTRLVRDLIDIDMERQRGSPFSECINQLPIPVKFKIPTWKMYIGLEDPVSHVHHFELQTDLQGVRDDARCRCFPAVDAMPLPAEPNDLVDIKQKDNEPLKEYIQHFMQEATRVKSLSDDGKLIAINSGVKEKTSDGNTTNPAEGSKNGGKNDKCGNGAGSSGSQNDSKKPKTAEQPKLREYIPKFTTYIILMESRADVFNATQAVLPYRRPPPLRKDASRRDMTKFCRFHNDYGHETNEYNHLNKEIEFLIRKNNAHLKRYVRPAADQHPQQPHQQQS